MSYEQVSVADGKYTVLLGDGEHAGQLKALRHGEHWQDLCGNNLVYWLAVELRDARAAQPQASHAEFALRALVAAGHITQDKADESLRIAGRVVSSPAEVHGLTDDTIADIYKSSMGQTLLDRHRGEVVRFARALLAKADVQPKGLTDADIRRVHDRDACLPDMVGSKDLWPDILGFARAIERAVLASGQAPAPVDEAGRAKLVAELMMMVGRYWDIAYVEGKEGRLHDTPAGDGQRVLSAIYEAAKHLAGLAPCAAVAQQVPPGWVFERQAEPLERHLRIQDPNGRYVYVGADCLDTSERMLFDLATAISQPPVQGRQS